MVCELHFNSLKNGTNGKVKLHLALEENCWKNQTHYKKWRWAYMTQEK